MNHITPATARQGARARRVQAIRDGALARERLGQAAVFRFDGGKFVVVFRGEVFSGATLEEAIAAAQGGPTP